MNTHRKSAIVEMNHGKVYLVLERGDKIIPPPAHWMGWSLSYGPFPSTVEALNQVTDWHKVYGFSVLTTERYQGEDALALSPSIRHLIVYQASQPYPAKGATDVKKPARIDHAAMEVECECGSTDLQLELLDIVASENPDGPWIIECNECGCEVDVFDLFQG